MRKLIITAAILSISFGIIFSQSQERPPNLGTILKGQSRGFPRPTPPSCCRPFRSVEVAEIGNTVGSGVIGGSGNTIPTPRPRITKPAIELVGVEDDIEAYRLSLEEYRKEAENLRKSGKITKEVYIKMLDAYKDKIGDYIEEFKRINK